MTEEKEPFIDTDPESARLKETKTSNYKRITATKCSRIEEEPSRELQQESIVNTANKELLAALKSTSCDIA